VRGSSVKRNALRRKRSTYRKIGRATDKAEGEADTPPTMEQSL